MARSPSILNKKLLSEKSALCATVGILCANAVYLGGLRSKHSNENE